MRRTTAEPMRVLSANPAPRPVVALLLWLILGCSGPNPDFGGVATGGEPPPDGPGDQAPAGDSSTDLDGAPPPPDSDQPRDLGVPDGRPDAADLAEDRNGPADAAPPDSSLAVGLVARYRLDPRADRTVPDDSGARNGTATPGTAWTADAFPGAQFANPGALSFDGTGYATLPAAGLPGVSGEKSVCLWFWQPSATTVFRRTLLTLANPTATLGLHLGLQRGIASVWVWAQADGDALLEHTATQPGGWTHLAYTHRAGNHVLYLNGIRVDDATASYGGTAATSAAILGAWSTTNTIERWSGLIDDVRLYDRALSPAEVSALAGGAP